MASQTKATKSPPGVPAFSIKPEKTLIDEPVTIKLHNLSSGQRITIRAQTYDDRGASWSSWALFQADKRGGIDLQIQQPLAGTYQGADQRGLFWSMTPTTALREPLHFTKTSLHPLQFTLTAEFERTVVAKASLTKYFLDESVTTLPVHEQGLIGTFFQPAGGPHPGMLVLGGSSGVLREQEAALLASHGYSTLALTYFGQSDLPPELSNIPLEYFHTAIQWLQANKAVQAEKLGILGYSKGGEAALLLGATFPEIKAIVAFAPPAVAFQGLSATTPEPTSSWSYQGKQVPFVAYTPSQAFIQYTEIALEAQLPLAFKSSYIENLDNSTNLEEATIQVEKTNGPLLIISGEDDQMWPAQRFGKMIMQRLNSFKHPFSDQHFNYPGAGHRISLPYLPTAGMQEVYHPRSRAICAYGGNPQGHAHAASQSWAEVRTFLEKHLK